MKQALVVLGMHRSGTSSVAGVFAKLGAAPPKTLMPLHDDNPKGYWESLPLVALSDRILESAGSSWHDWRAINPSWPASAIGHSLTEELAVAVECEFDGAPLIVLKDPRMCRILPVWQEALASCGYEMLIVSPLRHPLEVAASLQKRDGFSQARGLLIWLRHVLDAEVATRNLRRHIVRWSDFMEDWRSSVRATESHLGLVLPAHSDFIACEISDFLDQGLRRQQGDAKFPPHVPIWIRDAYTALIQLAEGKDPQAAQRTLDRVKAEFDAAATVFGPAFVGMEMEFHDWNARDQPERDHLRELLAVTERERLAEQSRANQLEQILATATHERDVAAAQKSELDQAVLDLRSINEDLSKQLSLVKTEASVLTESQSQAEIKHSDSLNAAQETIRQLTIERENIKFRVKEMEELAARPLLKRIFT